MNKIIIETYNIEDVIDVEFFDVEPLEEAILKKGKKLAETTNVNFDDYDIEYNCSVEITLTKKEKKENE